MDEYIKRQDAIDELMEMVKAHSGDQFGGVILHYTGIKAMLECIEPANVRPVVRGQWIYTLTEPLGYTCSVCRNGCCRFDFCPHCGADMRGEKNV